MNAIQAYEAAYRLNFDGSSECPHRVAHEAGIKAVLALAAISAPGSAGPGERLGEASCCEPGSDGWLSAVFPATPSPAQEPGTGDMGEIVAAFREAQEARDDAGFVGTVADCIRFFANPATTAETRGPADQTKGGL